MKKIKSISIVLITLILLCMNIIMANGAELLTEQIYITVKINNNPIQMDVLPYIKDGRTLVSIRFIAESLNAEVEWISEEKKVIIKSDTKTIELSIDSNIAIVNGEEQILDTKVEILNDRTMVPLRSISEILDCTVEWDSLTYSVLINKDDAVIPAMYISNRTYTDDDIIWLARIISVEGKGLSINGKVAIANVVLNRKESSDFPNSVYDVIFDRDYNIQFPPAHKEGFKDLIPSSQCVIAAKMALEGINNVDKSLFFNHNPFRNKAGDLYKIIDGEYFYF